MKFHTPSKTFFVGEYIALHGDPTLVINTMPCFSLTVEVQESFYSNLPPYPAIERLLADHHELLKQYQLSFYDPHEQKGGFGASSGLFAMLYAAIEKIKHKTAKIDWQTWLTDYQRYHKADNSYLPSGADFIGQIYGKITYFHRNENCIDSPDWSFNDLDFLIVRTGVKIPTDKHLQKTITFSENALIEAATLAYQALKDSNSEQLIHAVNQYGDILMENELVHPNTQHLLGEIKKMPGVEAVKGCGALGADTLLILTKPDKATAIKQWLTSKNLEIVATNYSIASGLQMV